jgi:hypothetical protein
VPDLFGGRDDPQRLFRREHAGQACRHELSDAAPGERARAYARACQRLRQRVLNGEERRLCEER